MSEGGEGVEVDTSSQEFQAAVRAELEKEHGGLLSAIEKERTARKEAERVAKEFDGIDLEEYKKLKTAAEEAEEKRQREAGNFEELRKKDQQKFEQLLGERDEKIESLTKSLEATLIESAAKTAIGQYGGDAELLLPHVTNSAKLLEKDGRHVAVVVDAKGDPLLAPDAKSATDYMQIDHLVSGWKEGGKFPGAFAGTGASGGGAANNSNRGGSGAPPKTISANDPKTILAHEEAIAKGEAVVTFD